MTHLCHLTVNLAVMHNGVLIAQRCVVICGLWSEASP
jgi:hypothetical protein